MNVRDFIHNLEANTGRRALGLRRAYNRLVGVVARFVGGCMRCCVPPK